MHFEAQRAERARLIRRWTLLRLMVEMRQLHNNGRHFYAFEAALLMPVYLEEFRRRTVP